MNSFAQALEILGQRGQSLAVAESLTGGMLCANFVDIPGASAVVRGGITAYTIGAKTAVLGIDTNLLENGGAVQAQVARQMAVRAAEIFSAEAALATTGVAGPESSQGHPVGTVFVGCCYRGVSHVRHLQLGGDRQTIRLKTCQEAVELLLEVIGNE